MTAEKLRISDIRYNPERAGFEARVTVEKNGHAWHYPSFVAAPLNAEFALISRGLTEAALRAHRSAAPGLRMHLRPLVKPVPIPFDDHPPLAA